MTIIRLPAGTITYEDAQTATTRDGEVPDHGYVEMSPEDAAKIESGRATLSAGYAVHQEPIRVDYVALMPDGALETVVDGRVICRGHLAMPSAPPNDLWPVRSYDAIRRDSYVLVVACWRRTGAPRVGPREAFDPLWDELMSWLAQCPTLTDIETFWVLDDARGWCLFVTGLGPTVRKDRACGPTWSGELTPLEAAIVKHWEPFAHFIYRSDQRAKRKRRAARKRKRGWA